MTKDKWHGHIAIFAANILWNKYSYRQNLNAGVD